MQGWRAVALAVVLVVPSGCAISDYGVITDNDESKAGGGDRGTVVNTAGKAHIIEKSQTIVIYPDGTDEWVNFVDQKADGTATLTAYNNFSTGTEPLFHDDLYCNAAWTGCSIWTSPDDNDDRLFDSTFNPNCSGARSTSTLLSTGRYYGECGRQRGRLGVRQKLSLLHGAVEATAFGRQGLLWSLDSSNTDVRVRNLETGLEVGIPLGGVCVDLFASRRRQPAIAWLDHPLLGPIFRDYAGRLDNELHTETLEVTITYNGVPVSFTVAGGAHPVVNSRLWRDRANRSF